MYATIIVRPSTQGTPEYQNKPARHKFTTQEDQYLLHLVQTYGQKNWQIIANHFPNRTARQCRERYKNYLSPFINKEPFTQEEDELLIEKEKEYGKQWSKISKYFQNRTDVLIKNRWATLTNQMKRKTAENDNNQNSPQPNKEKEPLNTHQEAAQNENIAQKACIINPHIRAFDNLLKQITNRSEIT